MDFDFLTILEDALGTMEGVEEIDRNHVMPNGESGSLEVTFENGRKYSIQFNPAK